MKGNYIINDNHRIYLSGYYGRDVFAFQDLMDINWGNATQTLRWNYIINERMFSNTSLIYSDYQHTLGFNQGINNYVWNSGITDYGKGDIYNTSGGLEPRLSAALLLGPVSSLKSSYSRPRQYMQLASNSSAGMPTDVWFPVSPDVKPQISDQVALGYFRNLVDNMFETSVEVYYKNMQNQIDFRDNAQINFN